MGATIDPRDHAGLAFLGANKAAARLRSWLGRSAPGADELVGAAYHGVEMSSRTFNPGRGLRFSTLAVRNAYFMALREGERLSGFRRHDGGKTLRRRERPATDCWAPEEGERGDFFDRWLAARCA